MVISEICEKKTLKIYRITKPFPPFLFIADNESLLNRTKQKSYFGELSPQLKMAPAVSTTPIFL